MIYLTTGGNGAGKTLLTLKDVREQQLKENRPVYFHGFKAKQVLLDWGWQEFDPKKWQDLPDGSICVMDECQNEFPAKIQGELPDYINAVAQHRRRRGFDFWMITPHPSLIHVNIRRLIESPSWHRHLKRTAGAAMVSEIKFNFAELKCEQPGSGARGVVSMRAYPKEVYDWYESASLHTAKVRIPKQVWLLAACVVLVPLLVYSAFNKVNANAKNSKQQEAAQGAAAPMAGASGAVPFDRQKLTADQYIEQRSARLKDFPHTAPAYDEVTRPTVAPYPAACVQMGKVCKCYTQQATLLQVSGPVCLQIVAQGFFVDWQQTNPQQMPGQLLQAQQHPGAALVPTSQQHQPPQVRTVPPPMPAAKPEPIKTTSEWAQGLAARNAQVRSSLTE